MCKYDPYLMKPILTYHLNKKREIFDSAFGLIVTLIFSVAIILSLIAKFEQTTLIIALVMAPILTLQWRLLYYSIKRILVIKPLIKIDSNQLIDSSWPNGKDYVFELSDITDITLFYAKGPKLKVFVSNNERYNEQQSLFDLFIRRINPKWKTSFVISLRYVKEHPDEVLKNITEFIKTQLEERKKHIT